MLRIPPLIIHMKYFSPVIWNPFDPVACFFFRGAGAGNWLKVVANLVTELNNYFSTRTRDAVVGGESILLHTERRTVGIAYVGIALRIILVYLSSSRCEYNLL